MKHFNVTKLYQELAEIKNLIQSTNAEFIDVDEAAKYLKFKKSYLYVLVSKNQIPYYKPNGKKIYFNKPELNTWIIQSKVKTINEVEHEYLTNQ